MVTTWPISLEGCIPPRGEGFDPCYAAITTLLDRVAETANQLLPQTLAALGPLHPLMSDDLLLTKPETLLPDPGSVGLIENRSLRRARLPAAGDPEAFWRFARTFDAVRFFSLLDSIPKKSRTLKKMLITKN